MVLISGDSWQNNSVSLQAQGFGEKRKTCSWLSRKFFQIN